MTDTGRGHALRLALAGIWLLDAALQFQPSMFTGAFGRSLATTAMGNAAVIADPITWAGGTIEQHPVAWNALFAAFQLLLAAGIAWRRTTRLALAASIAWAVAVWWLGEGFGGLFTGTATPVTGAPGAAILYVLLAVLLWPAGRDDHTAALAPFTAAQKVSVPTARGLWLTLWALLASLALWPQNRAPGALATAILNAAVGEPGWLTALNYRVAELLALRGLAASLILAALFALIAVGPYLRAAAARAVIMLAIATATVIWVVGEAFGGVLAGTATDPSTGPLLVLLALAFWPVSPAIPSVGSAEPPRVRSENQILIRTDP